MKYHIFVLGCQQNYYDAHNITQFMEKLGYVCVSEKEADLIVVMGCSVRQKPVDRIYGKLKKTWKNKKVIMTGCVLKEDKERFKKHGIEFIDTNKIKEELPKLTQDNPDGFVPIMTGCNNFCSYCVVPYTRGREKSRSTKEIIAEVKVLLQNRHKEIILLGQNVNSYEYGFVELLKKIEKLPHDFKITFLTSHPKDMSAELITWMGKSKKFSKKLHLPVQSGDDEILRKMNRHYHAKDYLSLIKKIRQVIPDVDLSTDIIVGFPGETKEQFENTIKLCKKAKFNMAYVSKYSPRAGTASFKMEDNVSMAEKTRRFRILDKLINS